MRDRENDGELLCEAHNYTKGLILQSAADKKAENNLAAMCVFGHCTIFMYGDMARTQGRVTDSARWDGRSETKSADNCAPLRRCL